MSDNLILSSQILLSSQKLGTILVDVHHFALGRENRRAGYPKFEVRRGSLVVYKSEITMSFNRNNVAS